MIRIYGLSRTYTLRDNVNEVWICQKLLIFINVCPCGVIYYGGNHLVLVLYFSTLKYIYKTLFKTHTTFNTNITIQYIHKNIEKKNYGKRNGCQTRRPLEF